MEGHVNMGNGKQQTNLTVTLQVWLSVMSMAIRSNLPCGRRSGGGGKRDVDGVVVVVVVVPVGAELAEYDRMQYLITVGGSLLLSPNAGCLTDWVGGGGGGGEKEKEKEIVLQICIITLSPNARHDSAELSAWFRSPFRKSHKLPVYKFIPQRLILRTRSY